MLPPSDACVAHNESKVKIAQRPLFLSLEQLFKPVAALPVFLFFFVLWLSSGIAFAMWLSGRPVKHVPHGKNKIIKIAQRFLSCFSWSSYLKRLLLFPFLVPMPVLKVFSELAVCGAK